MSSLSLRKSFNAAHTALYVLSTLHNLIAYISFDAWITVHASAISQDEMIPFELATGEPRSSPRLDSRLVRNDVVRE